MTNQERIWRFIKAAQRPVGVQDICEAFGYKNGNVRAALLKLKRICPLNVTGQNHSTRYTVPEGEKYRGVGAGNSKAGLEALRTHSGWRKGIARANANCGIYPRVPKPKTALERAWGYMKC